MNDFQETMLAIVILIAFVFLLAIGAYFYKKESCEQKSLRGEGK